MNTIMNTAALHFPASVPTEKTAGKPRLHDKLESSLTKGQAFGSSFIRGLYPRASAVEVDSRVKDGASPSFTKQLSQDRLWSL